MCTSQIKVHMFLSRRGSPKCINPSHPRYTLDRGNGPVVSINMINSHCGSQLLPAQDREERIVTVLTPRVHVCCD